MAPRGVLLLLLALALAACSAAPSPSTPPTEPSSTPTSLPPSATPSPTASPTPASPSAAPSAGAGAGDVIVTFRTDGDEEFRILLTDRANIRLARRLLAGEEEGLIPNGRIVRGSDGGVNTGWSWHIDPESVEFTQICVEIYDGLPSYIENGTHTGGDRFCPWSAEVVEIEPTG